MSPSSTQSDTDAEKQALPVAANNVDAAAAEKTDDSEDPILVDWESEHDAENPMDWSSGRKWSTILIVTGFTGVFSLASTAFAPVVPSVLADLHSDSASLSSFIVSVYIMGYCLGPFLIAPSSELYGRAIVLHIGNAGLLVSMAVCAVSENIALFIVFRFVMGFAGCVCVTLGGGVIADVLPPEKRGLAMTIWSSGPILGPTLGPVIGGYLALALGWRWIFYLSIIGLGLFSILALVFLRETYGPVILERKASRLRKTTGNNGYRSKFDTGRTRNQVLKAAFIRPIKMFFRSPIVALLALYTSIINSYLTILFATLGTVFETAYNFSSGPGGLAYLGLTVGLIIGEITVGWFSDKNLRHRASQRADGSKQPEDRLPPLIVGSILLPSGFLLYGWTVQARTHWIVPMIGCAVVGMGAMFSYLPVQLYLVDSFTLLAASAIASNSVVRSACSALLPLAADPLYDRLGYGWGNSVLAFIAYGFVPVALALLRYGGRLRTNPRFQPNLH